MSDASESISSPNDGANSAAPNPGQTASEGGGAPPAPKGGDKGAGKAPAAGDGGPKAEFWEGFGDEKLKGSPVVLRHKSVEDLARSLVAAESRLGVPADQLLRLPTKDDEFGDLYRKLGAPETPEGYKIELAKDATDDDKAMAGRFAEHMHKAGPFPPSFVKAALDFVNAENGLATEALTKAEEAARAEGEALLKQELGAAYDPDMKAVGKMLADLKIEGLSEELDRTGMGNSPRVMLALHKLMEGRSEPQTLEGGGDGTTAGIMTPGQAKAQRIALENDPIKGVALRDASHPMNKAVNEERSRLFAWEAGRNPDRPA